MITGLLDLIKEKDKLFSLYDFLVRGNYGTDRSNVKRNEASGVSRIPRLKAPQIAKINLIS